MATMTLKLPNVHGGIKLEVEYETEGDGSGPSYSPLSGADSGDPLIVTVLNAHEADTDVPVALTDAENEVVATYITEHHEFDDEQPGDY